MRRIKEERRKENTEIIDRKERKGKINMHGWIPTLVLQRRMLAVPPLMSLQVNPAIGIIV